MPCFSWLARTKQPSMVADCYTKQSEASDRLLQTIVIRMKKGYSIQGCTVGAKFTD